MSDQDWALGEESGRGFGDRWGRKKWMESKWRMSQGFLLKTPYCLILKPNTSLKRLNSVISYCHLCLQEKNEIHIQHSGPSPVPKDLHFVLPPFLPSGKMAHLLNKEICIILSLPTDIKLQVRCGLFCYFLNMASCWTVPPGKPCEWRWTSAMKG